jgi:hypothetical protein
VPAADQIVLDPELRLFAAAEQNRQANGKRPLLRGGRDDMKANDHWLQTGQKAALQAWHPKLHDADGVFDRNPAATVSKFVLPAPPENPAFPEDDLAATPGPLIIRRSWAVRVTPGFRAVHGRRGTAPRV